MIRDSSWTPTESIWLSLSHVLSHPPTQLRIVIHSDNQHELFCSGMSIKSAVIAYRHLDGRRG